MARLKQQTASALQLIDRLRAIIASQPLHTATPEEIADVKELAKELRKDREFTHTLLLAVLNDRPVPIAMFRPWASYTLLNAAERAGQIALERRNGKILITPAAFFRWFDTLPAQAKKPRFIN